MQPRQDDMIFGIERDITGVWLHFLLIGNHSWWWNGQAKVDNMTDARFPGAACIASWILE